MQKHFIMGDQNHGPFERVQRIDECIAGFDIQVVGRFVQQQQVQRRQQQFAQHDPGFFSPGQHTDFFQCRIFFKHHGPADVPGCLAVKIRMRVNERFLDGLVVI